jgi:site-specific DNA-adenine methylase
MRSPFPWFGGKRRVAELVWPRFGIVQNYVEPFLGSGAVLLKRPAPFSGIETVNDLDGMVANFWRSIRLSPNETAISADNPVNENDLHARHVWLVENIDQVQQRLEGDPNWHDPKIAGWWVWGISCWIGHGFCSGNGPWWVDSDRKLVHLGDNGRGVNRQLVHLGGKGQGVNRQLVRLGGGGQSVVEWFLALSSRLRHVRVASGDWSRVCGPSVTYKHGVTAVFLDPPYSDKADRNGKLYRCESLSVAHDVRRWAIEQGDNPLMRIALCGYEKEHEMPSTWQVLKWKAGHGYAAQADERSNNHTQETIWFSPHCLSATQRSLFDEATP